MESEKTCFTAGTKTFPRILEISFFNITHKAFPTKSYSNDKILHSSNCVIISQVLIY
jgi:hypothetical protein